MINGTDLSVVSNYNGFTDGKSDAHAAMCVRSTFRRVAGTVKDCTQLIWINSNTVILHTKNDFLRIIGNSKLHR